MTIWRRLLRREGPPPPVPGSTALDIGTEYAKALVFEAEDDARAIVRGVGRKRQGLSHMQSGTVADIAAVVRNCRVALDEAEEMAGRRPKRVIIGIAGELVKGFTTSRSVERKRPDHPISDAELERLIEHVEREAMHEATRTITWETGLPNVDVRLVHATVIGAGIDGYAVTNPVGFQGRHVRISVFNAYAPLVHLGALQSVVAHLGLELISVVAEPFAVARSLSGDQITAAGALFIDVGGGTTDVALVRQGGVEGTRMFALGGRAFTKSLADRLDVPFEEAERLKIEYARGADPGSRDEIATIISEDIAVWSAGVELVLEEFGKEGLLPGRIELCGGGAGLPEIAAALAAPTFAQDLPFARPPQVSMMSPEAVEAVQDATGLLVDQQDVTPMALAYQVIEADRAPEPLDAALRRVLRGLRV
jgi:cell division protein FtsA